MKMTEGPELSMLLMIAAVVCGIGGDGWDQNIHTF